MKACFPHIFTRLLIQLAKKETGKGKFAGNICKYLLQKQMDINSSFKSKHIITISYEASQAILNLHLPLWKSVATLQIACEGLVSSYQITS